MISLLSLLSFALAQSIEEPELECSPEDIDEYDYGWHLASVFIVFFVSLLGSLFAVYICRVDRSKPLERALLLMKLFGIGIISATAWMHLLPDAFESFSSECLTGGWEIYGTAYVGLFAFSGACVVQLIEVAGQYHAQVDEETTVSDKMESQKEEQNELAKQISAVVLEFGILFHSVIIGITLGVSPDSSFAGLLFAIAFHQLFEALALGMVVADTSMKANAKYILAVLYPFATPVGTAIGIFTRDSYNENANAVLVTRGIFNSISAGILMYNTYADLVAFQMTHNEALKKERPVVKYAAYLAFYCGAAAMAVIAVWA